MRPVQFLTAIFSDFSATGMTNSTGTDGTAGTMFVVMCFFLCCDFFFSSAALCPYFNDFWVQDVRILSLSLFETANFGNFLGVMNRNDSLIFSRETRMCGTLIVTYIHLKLKLHRDSKEKMEYHD